MRKIRFIDLFAGIGGFHVGMAKLGAECVYACEIDSDLRNLYEKNYGIYPGGDIRQVSPDDIPAHHVACAGFPCVSYSVAGSQLGHDCPQWGNLVNHALDLIFSVESEVIFLENVDNLVRLNKGKSLEAILTKIEGKGYSADYRILSPDQFGIPQHRKRVYIIASKRGLKNFQWPNPDDYIWSSSRNFLGGKKNGIRLLEKPKEEILNLWQHLLDRISLPEPGLNGVIFAAECGATYPYDINFLKEPVKNLRRYKGAFGADMSDCFTRKAIMERLPPYVSNLTDGRLPHWKKSAIMSSRGIFKKYKSKISGGWASKVKSYECNSWQRLEWRSDRENLNLWDNIIQFRPSGIRIIRKDRFPCFVAMTPTQVPLLGWKRRYISSREALELQGMEKLMYNSSGENKMMRAVGNAVNAHVIYSIASKLKKEIGYAG